MDQYYFHSCHITTEPSNRVSCSQAGKNRCSQAGKNRADDLVIAGRAGTEQDKLKNFKYCCWVYLITAVTIRPYIRGGQSNEISILSCEMVPLFQSQVSLYIV